MSKGMQKAQEALIDAIKKSKEKGTKPYDTSAEVVRVDSGIAWVHIPGGVDETPCEMTIACAAGDKVKVRVADGRCYTIGNSSKPPTDDTTAVKAKGVAVSADTKATNAQTTAEAANTKAEQALTHAKYFWHDAEGAHVSDTPRDMPQSEASSTLMTDSGMIVKKGNTQRASFGEIVTLGDPQKVHTEIDADSMDIYPKNAGTPFYHVGLLNDPVTHVYHANQKISAKGPRGIGKLSQGISWSLDSPAKKICPANIRIFYKLAGQPEREFQNVRKSWFAHIDGIGGIHQPRDYIDANADVTYQGSALGWSTYNLMKTHLSRYLTDVVGGVPTPALNDFDFGVTPNRPCPLGGPQDDDPNFPEYYTFMNGHLRGGEIYDESSELEIFIDYEKYYNKAPMYYLNLVSAYYQPSNKIIQRADLEYLRVTYDVETEEEISSFYAGKGLKANNDGQFVLGQYNDVATDEDVLVVGNGTDENNRLNTFCLKRNGNVYIGDVNAGDIDAGYLTANDTVSARSDLFVKGNLQAQNDLLVKGNIRALNDLLVKGKLTSGATQTPSLTAGNYANILYSSVRYDGCSKLCFANIQFKNTAAVAGGNAVSAGSIGSSFAPAAQSALAVSCNPNLSLTAFISSSGTVSVRNRGSAQIPTGTVINVTGVWYAPGRG